MKKTLKCLKWLGICIVALAALFTAYIYIGGIEWGDWTIPDEKELWLEKVEVPDEDNAYLALRALTNLYHVAEGDGNSREISDKTFVGYFNLPFITRSDGDEMAEWAAVREDPSSPKRAERILADNAKFFEEFRAALSLKGYAAIDLRQEDAKRKKEGKHPWGGCLPLYKPFIDFVRLVELRAQVALERGDVEAAVSSIGEIHALGQLLKVNNEALGEYLVGALIEEIFFRKMCEVVAMGKATDEVVERFSKMVAVSEENAPMSWERALKTEIAKHFEWVEWICSHPDEWICSHAEDEIRVMSRNNFDEDVAFPLPTLLCRILSGWPGFAKFALHRREMLYRQAMLGRAMLAGDDDLTKMILHEIPRSPLLPNFVGNSLAHSLCSFFSPSANASRLISIRPRLILAAEKWRRAHGGKNPPTLDALVPDYLATVPSDPWDKAGGPIKYDAALGVFWSVGKEGKYDYMKVAKEHTAGSKSSVDDDTQNYAFRIDGKPIGVPAVSSSSTNTISAEAIRAQADELQPSNVEAKHASGFPLNPSFTPEAVREYKVEADAGDTVAQYLYATALVDGWGTAKDLPQAFAYAKKAVGQGDGRAFGLVGRGYEEGWGIESNAVKAAESYSRFVAWAAKAAEGGDVDAQLGLGMCYYAGKGVETNMLVSAKLFRRAAERGYVIAQYWLGMFYDAGFGVEMDKMEALKWYRKAAERGWPLAQVDLGMKYMNGTGVEQDLMEAVKWFRKAAEQEDAPAQFLLGIAYENGKGVETNKAEAMKWYRKAAEQGFGGSELAQKRIDEIQEAEVRTPVCNDVKTRRPWLVPVTSCRSAMKGKYDSAVFIAGLERGLAEGEVISPSVGKCGYRVLSISDSCVWFEPFYGDEPPKDKLPRSPWPDFSRIDTTPPTPPPGRLIFGKRAFWPGETIKLPNSSCYLMVDCFLERRGAVFRLLDSEMRPVRDLLCVIVREQ